MTSCRVHLDAAMHSHHLLPLCDFETKPGPYITSFLRHLFPRCWVLLTMPRYKLLFDGEGGAGRRAVSDSLVFSFSSLIRLENGLKLSAEASPGIS